MVYVLKFELTLINFIDIINFKTIKICNNSACRNITIEATGSNHLIFSQKLSFFLPLRLVDHVMDGMIHVSQQLGISHQLDHNHKK